MNNYFCRAPLESFVLKLWGKFESGIISKSRVDRQQLYWELQCKRSRGNFSKRIKQYPQLFLLFTLIVYKNADEWYIEWHRVTTGDNKWYNEWQRMATNDKESYNEWQKVIQRMTNSDNEWQWVVILANFLFFFREESINRHVKENPLNLEEDLEDDLLN